jgi:phage-related protein
VDQFTEEPRMDPDALQRRVIGLAQVIVLHKRAGHWFTQALRDHLGSREAGNKWTAYDGAVRVFWPDPEFAAPGSNPFRHRLWFPAGTKHEREALENELFDVLSWSAIHKDEGDWLDVGSLQRLRDRHAIEVERERANSDASVYEGICNNLENDRVGMEARLKEAVQRAEDAEGDFASLQYQYRFVTEQLAEVRKRLPNGDEEEPASTRWTVVCYHRGGDRDCIDDAASSDEERSELRESLAWLSSPDNWAKPAGRLENLRDGVYEYRVNVKDHWFRLLVARLARLRIVVVLHAFPKKSNELPAAEIRTAVDRLKDLA